MIKNIKISYSIVYDFVMSMVRVSDSNIDIPFFKTHDEFIEKYKFDENIQKWIKKARNKIPNRYTNLIDTYFNGENVFYKVFLYFVRYNEFNDIEEFIEFIKSRTANELIAKHIYLFTSRRSNLETIDEKEALKYLENSSKIMELVDKTNLSPKRKWEFLQLCTNPEQSKNDVVELFEWYYNNIFKKESKKIENIVKKQAQELESKINKYGEEYLSLIISTDYKHIQRSIVLTISYFLEIGYFIFLIGDADEDLYVIGYRHMEIFVERKHGLLSNVQIFKVLGDETRQNLIKMLGQKEWYGDELSQTMGLSNSTVSYHLNMLLMEGFVKLNRVDKRSYFTLDREKLKKAVLSAVDRMIEG